MLLQALCIISYPLVNSNWSYSPETANLGQIRRFLEPCDLEIWRMTLKNNRAPLLSKIKLYISFHHHMLIQTGVTIRKRLSWVVTSVTLTFDLWPWPFAWTLPCENFMMIRWWEHSQKGVTDRQTDRQTENTIHRAAWSQLKMTTGTPCWAKSQANTTLYSSINFLIRNYSALLYILGFYCLSGRASYLKISPNLGAVRFEFRLFQFMKFDKGSAALLPERYQSLKRYHVSNTRFCCFGSSHDLR